MTEAEALEHLAVRSTGARTTKVIGDAIEILRNLVARASRESPASAFEHGVIEGRRCPNGLVLNPYAVLQPSPTGTVTLTRTELRANAHAAWCAGYAAHREGRQRHSPYAGAPQSTDGPDDSDGPWAPGWEQRSGSTAT